MGLACMASVILPPRPRQVPQTAAPSRLLTSWVLLFYLLLEKNSLSLWVCCGSNKLPCFSQLWNATKSNRVGRWLLPGKGATSLERNGEENNWIYAQDLLLCAQWETHILSQTTSIHTNTHVHTQISKSHRSALSCSTQVPSSFQGRGPRNDWWVGLLQNDMTQSLTTDSGRHWYTWLRQLSRSRHVRLLTDQKFQNPSCRRGIWIWNTFVLTASHAGCVHA